jgi:predicted ArsR family transcriptional regulator
MKRRKAFIKEERLIQIINKAAMVSGGDMRAAYSVSEVAKWIDLSATQTRKLLNDLITQGVMKVEEERYPGICKKRLLYGFTESYIDGCESEKFSATAKKPKRTVKINGAQYEIEGLRQ